MVPLTHALVLAAILFAIGAVGVFLRRNAIVIFMCIELMLNAVNLTFIVMAQKVHALDGQVIVFFVMTVAAAEAAIGLGIILALFRNHPTLDIDEIHLLKG